MKNTIFSLILIMTMLSFASCAKDGKDTTSHESKVPSTAPVTVPSTEPHTDTPQTERVTENGETGKVTLQDPLDAISDMLTANDTDRSEKRK